MRFVKLLEKTTTFSFLETVDMSHINHNVMIHKLFWNTTDPLNNKTETRIYNLMASEDAPLVNHVSGSIVVWPHKYIFVSIIPLIIYLTSVPVARYIPRYIALNHVSSVRILCRYLWLGQLVKCHRGSLRNSAEQSRPDSAPCYYKTISFQRTPYDKRDTASPTISHVDSVFEFLGDNNNSVNSQHLPTLTCLSQYKQMIHLIERSFYLDIILTFGVRMKDGSSLTVWQRTVIV